MKLFRDGSSVRVKIWRVNRVSDFFGVGRSSYVGIVFMFIMFWWIMFFF